MKIIVANYRYFIAGGPEKYMFKFMEAAKKRGVEVIPFSIQNIQNEDSEYSSYFAKPRSSSLLYKDTKKNLSNLYGMYRSVVWNWDAEKKLRKLIRATKPDAVYILHEVNHLSPSIIRAAKKEGVRVIHRISDFFMFCPKYDFLCGNDICEKCKFGDYRYAIKNKCVKGSNFATRLRIHAMKKYKRKKVFEMVDGFVATCEFSKNKLIECGIDQNKIRCIPTFIDSSSIVPNYSNKGYFLFLGRMAEQKGTRYAVEAMKYIKESGMKLMITGKLGDTLEDIYMKKMIDEYRLDECVVFTGFLKGAELEDLIKGAIAIVCPAIWYENMPNTVLEAYAYGKPIIASNIGCFKDLVVDGKTGYLFEMKNAMDLADKMMKFQNQALVEKLGKAARTECENKYNETIHIDSVLKYLKNDD